MHRSPSDSALCWPKVGASILESLEARFGKGPQSAVMPALLGVGRA